MQLFKTKNRLLKMLAPLDRSPGPPAHVQAHHGPFGQWDNQEHLATLQSLGLKPSDSVLDYGCGYGRMAEHLFAWGVENYAGIDCNAEAIAYARRHYGYPGYTFQLVQAESELYGNGQNARVFIPEGPTVAIAQSLVTHTLPGETASIFNSIHACPTITRAYVSCFIAKTCTEASGCGARIPLANGVWVKNKHNFSAVVCYTQSMFRRLAAGWNVEFHMGHWGAFDPSDCREKGWPYQDYAVLTR